MYLFNTLTKKKEEFIPLSQGAVGMYSCGPTVYDFVHIGNLRAFLFTDIVHRALLYAGFSVMQVMNITDIGHLSSDADTGEDKMMKGLTREGLPVTNDGKKILADKYTEAFVNDAHALNILPPDTMPRASEHIEEQITLIKRLEEKGLTYTTSDGVYFATSKYPAYGKLGGLSEADESVARVSANVEKENARDFALWKFNNEIGWESPWATPENKQGKGFPGWHIECSAMSMKYLGETFDIHTGGIDHIPVHHNNEIAQSEGATGKEFVRFWLHNAFLNVSDEKIGKSLGNQITLRDITEKKIDPLVFRYLVLGAHYRSSLNFTWEALAAAETALTRLRENISSLPDGGSFSSKYKQQFDDALFDDLNTPQALAVLWDMLRDETVTPSDKKETARLFDTVFGLSMDAKENISISEDVQKLLTDREEARSKKDWARADEIRIHIEEAGFTVKDTDEGQKVSLKRG